MQLALGYSIHLWITIRRRLLLTRKLLNQWFLLVKLKSPLRKFYGRHQDLVDRYGISVSQMATDICSTCRSTSRSFPQSWLFTGFVTSLTRRVQLVEQELLTLPEHLSSPPVFSRVRFTRSLVLLICFVDRCLSFCTFSFGHSVVLRYIDSDYPFGIFNPFHRQHSPWFSSNWFYSLTFDCHFLHIVWYSDCMLARIYIHKLKK
jgi:hypothetical protein